MKKNLIFFLFSIIVLFEQAGAQSGSLYYRSSVHNGNRVKTVFGNWGVIGQPVDSRPRGAWKYETNGYIGDVSLFVGAEVNMPNNVKFHSVVTCPVARPTKNPDASPSGDPWTFMPVAGYFNPDPDKNKSIAMNDDPNSWPAQWPDKMNDPTAPGWAGSWNGYFGKRASANQESYFVMDDNNDLRFNYAGNNTVNGIGVAFKPDSLNPSRNGLGLSVSVRGMQWNQTLAQDNIFWLYEITNHGTTTYNRAVFGMLVGTYVGVTGNTDFKEYDDDWSFYDVRENITYTGDYPRNNSRNPFWVGPVGMVGYAFLESPGNPYDAIDNDGDVDKWVPASLNRKFASSDFDSTLVKAGDTLVVINNNFQRKAFIVPAVDTTVTTRGLTITLKPGITKLAEGNVVTVGGKDVINPNAYDGIDNDLDGIIDENFFLHYRQVKKDPATGITLIDVLRPVAFYNYKKNPVLDPYSMIDERRDDLIDNDKDWNILFDDVGRDGIADPKNPDFGEKDGFPTSGYLADGTDTGLPGEPNIDKTDVDESDQIGLTSFYYYTPAGDIDLRNDEQLWTIMEPGNFSVPKSIQNNRPINGEDGDFVYGSGYFPLVAGKTERLSLALVYGGGNGGSREDDIADLLKHKITVQKIYDANYQFPIAPDPAPTLTAVAGDGKVKLYWDRKSEDAIDPVLRYKDFQGYKIFKATDREFNDAFDVTNANGITKGYKPIIQVDKNDSVSGYFYAPPEVFQDQEGFTYFMGNNTGLVHDTADYDVMNGRTYYYVIVAYDNGDAATGIMPSQNSWKITVDQAGRVLSSSSNVAIVTPGPKVLGYIHPEQKKPLTKIFSDGTGSVSYAVVDENKLKNTTYELTFNDTRDSGMIVPKTTYYSVRDSSYYENIITPTKDDTILTILPTKNLVPGTVTLRQLDGTLVPDSKYIVSYERGAIKAKNSGDLQPNPNSLKQYKIRYQYYPVYKSLNILNSPYAKETRDADIFDGMQLQFKNAWSVSLIDTLSGFTTGDRSYSFTFSTVDIPSVSLYATKYPSDYDIIFYNTKVDTSYGMGDPSAEIPVNFRIWNRTDHKFIKFMYDNTLANGKLSPLDQLFFFEPDKNGNLVYTWTMVFTTRQNRPDTVYSFGVGDTIKLRTTKPFRAGDKFIFKPQLPTISTAVKSEDLNAIRVVPNPYVVASIREIPPVAGSFSRGERRIEFQHVPSDAKISIFTVRGDLVRVLHADGSMSNGTVKWDVKSSENLDVAYGVYFYTVESSVGVKTGKIAIIK